MIQASVNGAYDFAQFDPKDRWCWKRLRWILDQLESERHLEALRWQHHHWVGMFASRLDNKGFDAVKQNSTELLEQLLDERFPWRKGQHAGGSVESAIKDFREIYGYPGDPRYEEMLVNMMDAFKKLKE